MSEISDLQEVRRFAERPQAHRARDIMRPPQAVERNEGARDAFHLIHQESLPGLPIVDEEYSAVGYVTLLELTQSCVDLQIASVVQ